ncbi:unknown [Rickettsia conorii str. Malish 7]|uniref:Uncharacterized protein n=1 Tax=Rickettsia conorii (strain ATCC VR-613 / Malish 7) TaxID=272944 RepID=Q92I09_RICCN|nr:unknown [Rickettsia conorii str. Malish 7]
MYSAIVKNFDIKNNYLRTIEEIKNSEFANLAIKKIKEVKTPKKLLECVLKNTVTKNLKIMSYLKSMRLVNIML